MPENTDQITETQQLLLDLAGAQYRAQELEAKLVAVEAQRDALDEAVEASRAYIIEVERLRDDAVRCADRLDEQLQRAHRVKLSPEIAPTIAALVDLHRLTSPAPGKDPHRYLAAAQKLAAPLVEAVLAD